MDIVSTFRRAACRHSDRLFLFDRESAVTYAEAQARADAIAAELRALGVEPGSRVGFAASDRVSLWLGILGAWMTGALPSMIDARTPADSLPYFLEDIDASLILAAPEITERLCAAGAANLLDLDEMGRDGAQAVADCHGPASPLYLSYTSGTTGAPKGAVLLSEPVTLATRCIADRLQLSCNDILLACTPISSSFQLVAALMPAIEVGAAVGLAAGSSVDDIWNLARQYRTTVLVAYPLTLSDVVNAPQAAESDIPFRVALSGGSSLAPRIKRDFRERMGVPLLESYGQSELGGFMAMGAPLDPVTVLDAGFAGRPLPDRLTFIGDMDCRELPAGQVGEVMVTHGYFDHYRNKPEKTAEAQRGGVLHTGDLGVADDDGYVKMLGRVSEAGAARERGGFLREVEDCYYEHDDVQHAAVVAGQSGRVEGFVELRQGKQASVQEMQEYVSSRVAPGLVPARTTILEKMPRTFSGKADRLSLARRVDES